MNERGRFYVVGSVPLLHPEAGIFSQYSSGWAVISRRSGGCEAVMAPDAIT